MDKFIGTNYDEIIKMSKRICKGSVQHEDVAHHAIQSLLESKKQLTDPEIMKYLSGVIHLSYYSKTSPYHKLYRQGGRVHELYESTEMKRPDEVYNLERDLLTEEVYGILEDMKSENLQLWYTATLMEQYIEVGNYSEIWRRTGIPRTSVSQAVEECKTYIKDQLKNRGIDYDY